MFWPMMCVYVSYNNSRFVCPSVYIHIFSIFSQTIKTIRLQFSGGDGGYHGVVDSDFGEDWIKPPPIELFLCSKKEKKKQKWYSS